MSSNWRDKSNRGGRSNYRNQKFSNQAKRKHQYRLEPGIAGFLCMCCDKFHEKDCVRDAYNILNEFADQLLGPEKIQNTSEDLKLSEDDDLSEHSQSDDIDASLEEELASLKEEQKAPVALRRFQVVDTGVNSVIFIKTSLANPTKLAHFIVSRIADTKKQKSRFLLRMLPIEVVCKANLDDICKAADPLLDRFFSCGDQTFSIVFNHRYNDSLKRDVVIDALAKAVVAKNATNKVDLKTPQLAVLVEVILNCCCLSVIPEFYKLKKYNILELSGANDAAKNEQTSGESTASTSNQQGTVEETSVMPETGV